MWRWLVLAILVALFAASSAFAIAPVTAKSTVPATNPTSSFINDPDELVIPVEMMDESEARARGFRGLDAFDSTMFVDSMEGDRPAWISQDLSYGQYWHLDDTLALGGSGLAWWCGSDLYARNNRGGGYGNHWLQYLILDTLNLSGTTSPLLAFKARWSIETPGGEPAGYNMWDTWNVWASTNNGATWSVLMPTAPDDNPDPGIVYTNTSSYAFGEEWGMGPGIPGYGGQNFENGYVECLFPLTSLVGQSSVLIRIAFCSDPAYCTLDDADMYGLIVDSIRVSDGANVLLANDGVPDEFAFDQGPLAADNWIYDTSTSNSPTHCWTAQPVFNSQRAIYSYPVTLPVGYQRLYLRYWVWADMPDADGDGNNSLEDYYGIYVTTNNGGTWTQIAYDYGYANADPAPGGNSLLGWVRRTGALTSGGTPVAQIELSRVAGQTVRIAFEHKTDGNDDGGVGTGLHIDDVEFIATRAYPVDLAARNIIIPFPTTVGLPRTYTYNLYNAGLNELTQLRHRIIGTRPNGTVQDSVQLATGATLAYGADTTLTRTWTPDMVGGNLRRVYCVQQSDGDRSNDTTRTPTNVPANPDSNLAVQVQPAGTYELGYNRRAFGNAYLNPRYQHFTPLADGVPAADCDTIDIIKLRVMFRYDPLMGDVGKRVRIDVWNEGVDSFHTGSLKWSTVTRIDTSETIGAAGRPHWWNLDLSCVPELKGHVGPFWISLTPLDSIAGDPSPLPLGLSPVGVTPDGHNYFLQGDTLLRQSAGRLLIQATIIPARVLPAPNDVTCLRNGVTNDVLLNWSSVDCAARYNVWRLTSPTQPYQSGTLLTPTPITATSFTDSGIVGQPANRHWYVVTTVY